MANIPWFRLLGVGLLAGTLSACASLPISQVYRDAARPNVTLAMVAQNPATYVGTTVIWGGRIIEIANTPTGSELVVIEMPLDGDERPVNFPASAGRFIAKTSTFLDPEIYQVRSEITLAGQVTGREERPVGKMQYAFPVVDLKQAFLWGADAAEAEWGYGPYYWPYPYGYWGWGWDWTYSPWPYRGGYWGRGGHFGYGGHFGGRR
jgi:outer membrane lipoprotein